MAKMFGCSARFQITTSLQYFYVNDCRLTLNPVLCEETPHLVNFFYGIYLEYANIFDSEHPITITFMGILPDVAE